MSKTTKALLVYNEVLDYDEDVPMFLIEVNEEKLELLKKHTGKTIYATPMSKEDTDEMIALVHSLCIRDQQVVKSVDIHKSDIEYVFYLGWAA